MANKIERKPTQLAAMRILSVDFYRGLTVAFMIIVNTAGSWEFVYPPLRHAKWHGFTPTDLVFPSFMFIIGVSMWFSFEKFGRKLSPDLSLKILKRTAILFCIGLILNKFPLLWKDWYTWRVMGVPQRLALGYCCASFLCLTLSRKWLLYVSAGLLLLYWGLLYGFVMPGGDPYGLETNAVRRLDLWLFSDAHLYHGDGIGFDPEGVLSTIPSVVTVILGWLSATVIAHHHQKDLLVRDLLAFAFLLVFFGLAWDLFFPINKKLWSSSFVLFAGGLSLALLSVSIYFIDYKGMKSGSGFFLAFGANPLFAYVLSEALIMILFAIPMTNSAGEASNLQAWIYEKVFKPIEGAEFSSFLFAVSYMLLCWVVCRYIFKKKIYIKI